MSTASQAVARSQQRLREAGGRRLSGHLQPDAAAALDALLAAGYAPTAVRVITAALLDARRKLARAKP